MKKVNVLISKTPRFFSKRRGIWGFVPFVEKKLKKTFGVEFRFFKELKEPIYDCDSLIISSRALAENGRSRNGEIQETLDSMSRRTRLIWFDERDSAGNIETQALPYVQKYWKKQLYRDRSLYCRDLYQGRLYSDYYHNKFGVADEQIEVSQQLNRNDLNKLCVAWNIGMLPLALQGSFNFSLLLKTLYFTNRYCGDYAMNSWTPPEVCRLQNVVALFGLNYPPTIRWQREKITKQIKGSSERLKKNEYIARLRNSKIVVSAFGWGEVCLREFEATIAGAAFIMPDMSHVETFPNIYRPEESYQPINWNLDDLTEKIELLLDDNDYRLSLAHEAQNSLRQAYSFDEGSPFQEHLVHLLGEC